jgi:hypothetical protein
MKLLLACALSAFAVLHAQGPGLTQETILALVARLPAFATPGPRSEVTIVRRMEIPETNGEAHFVEITWREAPASRTALLAVIRTERLDKDMPALATHEGWGLAQIQEDANWDTLISQLKQARDSSREASAIGNLRSLNSAQATFAAIVGQGAYAADLKCLATPRACGVESEPFLPESFLTQDRMGYRYTLTPVGISAGRTSGARTAGGYVFTAVPIDDNPGPSLCTDQEGLICKQEAGTPLTVTAGACPKTCVPLR